MPNALAANIDVWSNSHPLGQVTKNPPRSSGWLLDREDSQSGHGELETSHDPFSSHLGSSRGLDVFPARPRRPATRNDGQKLIEVRNRIFVGGLTEAINEDDLRQLFGRYGTVVEVAIKARGGEQFRGFGFVTFSRNCEAAAALRDGAGEYHTLQGKKINVCAAFKRVDKVGAPTPTMPVNMGANWVGPAPTPLTQPSGPLPVIFNPFYFGPPVISNGMWYVGPMSSPAGGMQSSPFGGLPFGAGMQGGGLFPPAGLFGCPGESPSTSTSSALFGQEPLGPLCHPAHPPARKQSESRMGMEFGTRNAMTATDPGQGTFTTNSLPAPWFSSI